MPTFTSLLRRQLRLPVLHKDTCRCQPPRASPSELNTRSSLASPVVSILSPQRSSFMPLCSKPVAEPAIAGMSVTATRERIGMAVATLEHAASSYPSNWRAGWAATAQGSCPQAVHHRQQISHCPYSWLCQAHLLLSGVYTALFEHPRSIRISMHTTLHDVAQRLSSSFWPSRCGNWMCQTPTPPSDAPSGRWLLWWPSCS